MESRKKLSTETFSVLAVVVLVLALFITIIFSIYSGISYLETQTRLQTANERLFALNMLLSGVKDAETGERGFLLTGKTTYLGPYEKSRAVLETATSLLRQAYRNDTDGQAKIEDLLSLKTRKIAELILTLETYSRDGSQAAIKLMLNDTGKNLMDALRAAIYDLRTAEQTKQQTLLALTSKQVAGNEITYATLGILTLAFGIAISYFIVFSARQKKILTDAIQNDLEVQKSLHEKLQTSNEQLAEKVKELDEFTYIASHDLQEPLRKLVAFSELLKTDLPGEMPEQATSDLFYIVDAGYRMQALIRDLLDFSRLGRREMMSKTCNLDRCLDRALEDLSLKIDEKRAIIERDALPEVFGDEPMLVHIFLNLIGNALKFVPEERKPLIRVSSRKEPDFWYVEISDNGIGIDEKYFEQIFAPFKRLHGKEAYEGSGIGLAMCKKIVERHGGSIGIRSELGTGSCFFFTLPISRPIESTKALEETDETGK